MPDQSTIFLKNNYSNAAFDCFVTDKLLSLIIAQIILIFTFWKKSWYNLTDSINSGKKENRRTHKLDKIKKGWMLETSNPETIFIGQIKKWSNR